MYAIVLWAENCAVIHLSCGKVLQFAKLPHCLKFLVSQNPNLNEKTHSLKSGKTNEETNTSEIVKSS